MRLMTIPTSVSVLLTLTLVPVYAGQRGNSDSHGPKTTTHGPKATGTSAKPVKVQSTKHTTTTKAETKLAKADTSATKLVKSKKTDGTASTATSSTGSSTTSTTSTTGTSTTSTPSTIDFTAAPVGQKLSKNSALRSKLETRLQALGYTGTSYQAAYGFKNLGQCVAAINVSRNLGIPFDQLKVQMTGLTVKADGTVLKANIGTDGKVTMVDPADVTKAAPTKSLGQSIQTVKSTVDATAAAQTATTQADAEIQSTTTGSK
jgi:hypothetical protein